MLEKVKKGINKGLLSASVISSTYLEIGKIKGKMEKEKEEINQCFSELGNQIYELWKADSMDMSVIDNICKKIQSKETAVETYVQEIVRLEEEKERVLKKENRLDTETYIRCQTCGGKNARDGKFCVQCGSALPNISQDEEDNKKTCSCGAVCGSDAKFCTVCGKLLLEEDIK
ncbi:zinc ribbon domain-containing protein [Lachnoclostridium edouardi]|uniref:zinc ribbon domain-containing protein n=1 Tax=Lachnoclostridium edouardi TaxID=1926283 RepID=UPI000C7C8C85|nr:zinc ribbon domain-containing protein [Lachnoclostridium edouardi]